MTTADMTLAFLLALDAPAELVLEAIGHCIEVDARAYCEEGGLTKSK